MRRSLQPVVEEDIFDEGTLCWWCLLDVLGHLLLEAQQTRQGMGTEPGRLGGTTRLEGGTTMDSAMANVAATVLFVAVAAPAMLGNNQ